MKLLDIEMIVNIFTHTIHCLNCLFFKKKKNVFSLCNKVGHIFRNVALVKVSKLINFV